MVMIITNDQGMQHLLSSKFKLGAEASVAAGPVGRDAGADTDWKMKADSATGVVSNPTAHNLKEDTKDAATDAPSTAA